MASSNTIINPSIIAKEALFHLENNLVMGNLVHRAYEKEFRKVGSQITIRKPVQFTVTKSATRTNQNVVETSTTLDLNVQAHVSWSFTSAQLTQTIENYSERYIKPAMIRLAQTVDYDLCGLYAGMNAYIGTAGSPPILFSSLGNIAKMADLLAIPDDGNRILVVDPTCRWGLADALKGVFVEKIVEDALRRGHLGTFATMKIFGSQNVRSHALTATDLAANVEYTQATPSNGVATIGVEALEAAVYEAGTIFESQTTYWVNPLSKASTGIKFSFANAADTGGTASETITYASGWKPYSTTPLQNISAFPADESAIVVIDDHVANMMFHKNGLALCMAPLVVPDGVGFSARESSKGLSVRVVKDYDIAADEEIIRLDILYGVKVIYPELCIRVLG
jgi:hypothetical protein